MGLGRSLYLQINAILKLALEDGDIETFRHLEAKWAGLFEDEAGYVYGPGRESATTPAALRSYRLVLVLGLAMWAARLYAKSDPSAPASEDSRVECLRILAGRFADPEALLDAHEDAVDREQADERGVPWTNWFLGEFGEGGSRDPHRTRTPLHRTSDSGRALGFRPRGPGAPPTDVAASLRTGDQGCTEATARGGRSLECSLRGSDRGGGRGPRGRKQPPRRPKMRGGRRSALRRSTLRGSRSSVTRCWKR